MKRILLATDFSESCENALRYTSQLVEQTNIIVDLIHVYDIPFRTITHLSEEAAKLAIDKRKEQVGLQMEELMDQIPFYNRGISYSIYGMYPSTEVSLLAKKIESDLIVMALRQKYSMIDRMMGTVTAHTIQISDTPVLAIPSGAVYKSIQQILFPTAIQTKEKLTKKELDALFWLTDFSNFCDNSVIQIIHIDKEKGIDIEYTDKPFPDMNFIASHAPSVESGILSFMESESIDLLAFYKSNRTFWQRLYKSNITRKLLFQSRLPLLIFS